MRETDKKIEELFGRLSRSKFRSGFCLRGKELYYFQEKGIEKIMEHGRDFITKRLAPANPRNDGKQTPVKNHPVFIAQHATATCCRGCLEKWHGIDKGRALSEEEISYILHVLRTWLVRETGEK